MKTHTIRLLWLMALAAMALAAVACGGEKATPTPTIPAVVKTPTATTTPTPVPPTPTPEPSSAPVDPAYPGKNMLVDTGWLKTNLNRADLRIVDVRTAAKYQEGHIPGAINLLSSQYTVKVGNISNELPSTQDIGDVFGNAGIGDDSLVVIYDDGNSLSASRLYWTLDFYSQKNIRILNGGFAAWAADGRETTRVAPQVSKAVFIPKPDYTKLATKSDVEQALNGAGVAFCDARTPGEYAGTDIRSPATRGGHIPGALNHNWSDAVRSGEGVVPAFDSNAELQVFYANFPRDEEIITYCQSGVRAAHAYFTLKLAGFDDVRNYDGSWEDWGSDPNTAIEK